MITYIGNIYRSIMYLTPKSLLSSSSLEQCIAKLNDLPNLVQNEKQANAAVLVPICVVGNEVCLLYTLRSLNLSTHSGQVSFPGGRIDNDESEYEAAVRETEEEIGVPPHQIDIWTKMCKVRGRDKRVIITPVVGELKDIDVKQLRPNESEVAEIFTVPMRVLCDKENHASFIYQDINTPIFICGKHKVWGITAIITHLFLECFLPHNIYQCDFSRKTYKLDELMPAKL